MIEKSLGHPSKRQAICRTGAWPESIREPTLTCPTSSPLSSLKISNISSHTNNDKKTSGRRMLALAERVVDRSGNPNVGEEVPGA